ncbi:MAG: AMP-binding protein [Chthoniobacterales bacterium]
MATQVVPSNVADLFRRSAETFADVPAFASRQPDGEFAKVTYAELYAAGLDLATGLIDLGVDARDHVGLLADNRFEWILSDCAVQVAGAVDVPRGTDITRDEVQYILEHADVGVAIVENAEMLAKVRACTLPNLREVILMDAGHELPEGARSLANVQARGAELRAEGDRRAEERLGGIRPEDLFTIIYTSGTTGTPKGVQLTHANMASQIRNLPFRFEPGDRALSILPIWHSYERVFENLAMSWGVTTYYTSLRHIGTDLQKVRPNIMVSTPRLWEGLYLKIMANVASAPPLRRALFRLATTSTERVHRAGRFFRGQNLDVHGRSLREKLVAGVGHALNFVAFSIPHRVLDPIVLKKVRGVVGGEFRMTISGGGALQRHVDEFFNFIGIPVFEGYGLTESSPVLAVRTFEDLVIGTVGPVYPGTEIRIVDLESKAVLYPDSKRRGGGRGIRGEVHARGPQIMKGYYKDLENTERVLRDGWLNTGDIGMVTFNDCLKILGRSKDTIVLQSGENVEPVPIEGKLMQSELIDQCMVVGQDEKSVGALIVPTLAGFQSVGLNVETVDALLENDEARRLVTAEIRRLVGPDTGFKSFEQVRDWRFVTKSFAIGDEMTATLKLKRHVIGDKYAAVIHEMFA